MIIFRLRPFQLTLLAFSALASGCIASAKGPLYRPVQGIPPDQAIVYVYRVPSFAFSGQSARIRLDGEKVAEISHKGYSVMSLPPGEHTLTLDVGLILQRIDLKVDFKPGQTYYFAMQAWVDALVINWRFFPVEKWSAGMDLHYLHYQPPLKYAVPDY